MVISAVNIGIGMVVGNQPAHAVNHLSLKAKALQKLFRFRRAFQQGCDRVVVVLTRERSYRRQPEKLQPLIDLRYHKYPHFCETMRRRAETYNADREELFRLEREGKVLLLAPEDTRGFSRVERDVDKIRALWQSGYDQAMERMEEIRDYFNG